MDFAGKAEEHVKELKQLLEAAEQRTSEEMARRAEEKRLYEEEIVKVREEGKRRVEEVSKMTKEIAQRLKEEASRRDEEKRSYVEEMKRVREEGSERVERVANMAEGINRQVKEEAMRRDEEKRIHNEEIERIKNEGNRREEEIFKRAEDATKKAQEAIAVALAGKEEAERRSANLMQEAEEKIQKAVEEAMMRVEQRKGGGGTHTKIQYTTTRNSEELPDSDVDVGVVEDLVRIPEPSNRGIDARGMDQRVEQKVTFFELPVAFWLKISIRDPCNLWR